MDISKLKTPDFELFQSEIHTINKIISQGRNLWNRYITLVLINLIKDIRDDNITDTFIDRCNANILSYDYKKSPLSQFKIVKNYPKIYVIGGAAYNAYDEFINISNNSGINIDSFAPATHDYDILMAFTQLTEENFNKILNYLVIKLQYYSNVLAKESYLETFFEEFVESDITKIENDMGGKRIHDMFILTQFIDDIQKTVKNKQYISINIQKSSLRKDSQYDYINIRCSVKIKKEIIEDGIKKIVEGIFDIFEFNLTNNNIIEIPIKCINILVVSDLIIYNVPDAHSLIKLGIYSLIKRGLNKQKIIKCRQDYKRVRYFIETRMNKLYSDNTDLALKLYYLLPKYKYLLILNNIIKNTLLNHCVTDKFIRDEFLKTPKETLNIEEEKLLDIFIESFKEDVLNIKKYKQKYLKYKEKYLKLKKSI